jgi:hypothetical protein
MIVGSGVSMTSASPTRGNCRALMVASFRLGDGIVGYTTTLKNAREFLLSPIVKSMTKIEPG